jgi:copper chaperone CopZ
MVSVLTIAGMVAVHAKRAVYTALSGVPGVLAAEVELGRAVVEHDSSTSTEHLVAAVESAGCEVLSVKIERRLPLTE